MKLEQNEDTVKLLKECDAGIKMGISSIQDGIENATDPGLRDVLIDSQNRHKQIGEKVTEYLAEMGESGKEPAMLANIMAKIKQDMKLMSEYPNQAVADVMTDGCNMGIKSIYKYFNQYKLADQNMKKLVDDIIHEEEELQKQLRAYL